jgi:hypothetical protein
MEGEMKPQKWVVLNGLTISIILIVLCGCATTQRDWKEASQKGTIAAYQQFVDRHPEGREAELARQRIQEMRAEEDWRRIGSRGTIDIDGYRKFLAKYPTSLHSAQARERLKIEEDWMAASSTHSMQAYKDFLMRHPKSHYTDQANQRLDTLEIQADVKSATPLGGTEATASGGTFRKTNKDGYIQAFAAPRPQTLPGTTMHAYVVRMLEASGQRIVPGCIATMTVKGGRFVASVNHAAPMLFTLGRDGQFSPAGPPLPTTGGSIRITFASDDLDYDYYKFGDGMTTWERLVRKSSKEGKPVVIKAVKKGDVYYLKNEAQAGR